MTIDELELELSMYPSDTEVLFSSDEEGNDIYASAWIEPYDDKVPVKRICIYPGGYRVEE